eukprot:CAMPEP_0170567324 /NCGR_PEP_ID=MMETSP0211-20121228/80406_1 /TAXON_ID=311385 /ORGANISM="Pseudokeronopsis sp., Strain OXSARD2" /LENGTH=58 /DNA_ID=CAMNT_0010888743 /DNA_START=657 /DNA_END=836 /DNA_ORIENTATION=+
MSSRNEDILPLGGDDSHIQGEGIAHLKEYGSERKLKNDEATQREEKEGSENQKEEGPP